ncbi:hypothetical protein Hypma_002707 [Hypsizygus marmoreus]|uniref:Protein ECM3 n=1 Tax=Hypsizygus marmoreus TaxID=39966 RepID=A0A369J3D3_HYPMA|nr:hypothetical protein Hypma_002707 [Hypsizygus marmoreus]
MLSAGELIWASCRPLIRLALVVASGFVLTKTDNFPPVAARGAGQVMLNIALPCLMFSKIVPAFDSGNVGALGPLVLVALLYEALGIAMAWIIKQFFWVPHRFRYGILVAGGWANVGHIPTSVIVSVTGAAPFNGTTDQTLAVAYISAFILVFMVTLFPCGANRWIAMGYVGPDVEPEEVRDAVLKRREAVFLGVPRTLLRWRRKGRNSGHESESGDESWKEEKGKEMDEEKAKDSNVGVQNVSGKEEQTDAETRAAFRKHVSFSLAEDEATTIVSSPRSPGCSRTPTEVGFRSHSPDATLLWSPPGTDAGDNNVRFHSMLPTTHNDVDVSPVLPTSTSAPTLPTPSPPIHGHIHRHIYLPPLIHRILRIVRNFLLTLLTPASLAIILSFPIALIPPLKALFVPLPSSSSIHIHPAPDGQPPLAFFIDTTAFIGAASVPLGLICLGAALARLNVPGRNQWGELPLGAIGSLAIGKVVVMPVIGVGIVKGLVHVGVVGREDKVLQFVCIFLSCLPTATTQVFLTQVFSGTGSAEHLPAFLIPQYIIMFVSMTALTAYTLHTLF